MKIRFSLKTKGKINSLLKGVLSTGEYLKMALNGR